MRNHQDLKGIALILFGILLCAGGMEINYLFFRDVGDFPFSLVGILLGVIGLWMVLFNRTKEQ